MKMLKRVRLMPAALIPIAAAMVLSGSAHASLLTASAPSCGTASSSQVFMPWGDPAEYFLAPDGSFSGSAVSWSLSGGASAVAGGDGYALGGNAPSAQSLSLPDGSSATTPSICVGITDPTVRFFAQGSASAGSSLLVSATVTTSLGVKVTLPIADLAGAGTWQLTPALAIVENLLPLLPGNETPITLTFTPLGVGGNWQIDDLYVDPWTRGN
jgi:hypothetical protein